MPTYVYKCSNDHVTEDLRPISEHEKTVCPVCGEIAYQQITPVHLDWNAGVDPDFPTFAAKWEKLQRNKASGKQWDSNNERYGGNYERR